MADIISHIDRTALPPPATEPKPKPERHAVMIDKADSKGWVPLTNGGNVILFKTANEAAAMAALVRDTQAKENGWPEPQIARVTVETDDDRKVAHVNAEDIAKITHTETDTAPLNSDEGVAMVTGEPPPTDDEEVEYDG